MSAKTMWLKCSAWHLPLYVSNFSSTELTFCVVARDIIHPHCIGFSILKMITRADILLEDVIATDIENIHISICQLYSRSSQFLSISFFHGRANVIDKSLYITALQSTYDDCLIQPVHCQHTSITAIMIKIIVYAEGP